MDEAARICAVLLREGTARRDEIAELDRAEVRREVEDRLEAVGLRLATSAYSEHVGLRLSPEVTADTAFDAASNVGLKADACALLVVLWARLVLQKRTVEDSRRLPDERAPSLLPEERARSARDYRPSVRLETVAREFGHAIGSRSHIKRLVGRLRNLGFLAGRGETIEAGPLLELGIDGEKMVGFVRREVLADLLRRREEAASSEDDDAPGIIEEKARQVLDALAAEGGTAAMGELRERTGRKPAVLRRILSDLEGLGRVRRTGERFSTRYHLVEEEGASGESGPETDAGGGEQEPPAAGEG